MPHIKKDKFSDLLLRQRNMKIAVKDMKAHERIVGDGTFKKDIKKEEKKTKLRHIEDIFDKAGQKKLKNEKRKR
tara:strand:- start:833 stop:1054 length:222 start_codon:yes stop_codon:yes gene_type:complete